MTMESGVSMSNAGIFDNHTSLFDHMVELSDDIREERGEFIDVMIPMFRRTMPGLIAEDIVGVQPMDADVGAAMMHIFGDIMVSGYDKKSEVDVYLDRIGVDNETDI